MIKSIFTRRLWANSNSGQIQSRTITVYVGDKEQTEEVTALINLSRISGGGTAKAYIFGYCENNPLTTTGEICTLATPTSDIDLLSEHSALHIRFATSVTFQVLVQDIFALATCEIFTLEREIKIEE